MNTADNVLTVGRWHHLAFVAGVTGWDLYIDNVNVMNNTTDVNDSLTVRYMVLGARTATGQLVKNPGDTISGSLDEVRIYDRALSADEITEIYNARCVWPDAQEGVINYDSDDNVMAYCDGRSWQSLAKLNPAAGGSGCTNPNEPEGVIRYNDDLHKPMFCDGDDWIVMGFGSENGCPVGGHETGYFVITNGTWDGDLQTAAGVADGFGAANKLCYDDLVANDWMGKSDAQARGILTQTNVQAFLCLGNGSSADYGCQNVLPNTEYFFAVSGDAAKGGASFTSDSANH